MNSVAATLEVARSHLAARVAQRTAGRSPQRRGSPPLPEEALLAEIEAVIDDMPSYGYARVWARLRRKAMAKGRAPANRKRVYRVMKVHGLLLERHAGGVERRHDGRIAVARSNLRWCSDGFEIGCDNGEKVRVAFALDCCDREAMGHVATTEGIKGEDVCDLMVTAVEHRFGKVNRLPQTIEWLTDNGRWSDPALCPRDRPGAADHPGPEPAEQRHGRSLRAHLQARLRRGESCPGCQNRHARPAGMVRHYNELHPHRALGYRSPREFIAAHAAS
jgi:putative transposase